MHRRFPTAISLLLVFLSVASWGFGGELPTAKPEEVGVSSQGLERLDAYVQKIVDDKQLPGVVVMMARHGKVVHLKPIGQMDLGAKKPMCPDAIFRIASMTKPVTSVAVMILCDEGRLGLDDPISKYIPEFKNPRVLVIRQPLETVPAKREITIRDLLRHTSGLTYVWNPLLGPLYQEAGIVCGLTPEKTTLEENVKRLAKMPLLFSPGEKWEYGLSTDVLGRVVEIVSGMPLDQFCQKRIFTPLGMNDTQFHVPNEKINRLPAVYVSDDKVQLRRLTDGKQEIFQGTLPYSTDFAYDCKTCYLSGGAGLCSTASDYLRFCQMLLNGGQLDGKTVLREETARAMRTNQIGELNIAPGQKFGLGFRVVEKIDQRDLQQLVGSYSWGGFFGTLFWIVPKEDWILVVMLQEVGGPKPPSGWPGELERLAAAAVVK